MEGYRSGHNEAVLKTVWVHAHVGSNPTPSVKTKERARLVLLFFLKLCDEGAANCLQFAYAGGQGSERLKPSDARFGFIIPLLP